MSSPYPASGAYPRHKGTPEIVEPGPATDADNHPRCWRCNRLLAELVTRPWIIVCSRCKARNGQGTDEIIDYR